MSQEEKDPKTELINELIQLSSIRDEYWSYHPANPHSVDVTKEIPKIDETMKEIQNKIELLNK